MICTLTALSEYEIIEDSHHVHASLCLDLREHRYLYSHCIDGKVVIPSIFLLEMALGVLTHSALAQSAKTDYVTPSALTFIDITAPRLAYLVGGPRQRFYVDWLRLPTGLALTIRYDKLTSQGQCARPKLTVLTAQLVPTCPTIAQAEPQPFVIADLPTFSQIQQAELISRETIHDFKEQSPGALGMLFSTLEYRYHWQRDARCLWAYADISNSAKYCFSSEPNPQFITPVLACMSAIQHLPFYGFLQGEVALPANVGRLTYLDGWQDHGCHQGKWICQITPAQRPHHVNILLLRQADLKPIAQLCDYQLVPRLAQRKSIAFDPTHPQVQVPRSL